MNWPLLCGLLFLLLAASLYWHLFRSHNLRGGGGGTQLETEHLRSIFNASQDAIFVLGLDEQGRPTHFVDVNEVACIRLEYSRDELLALSPAAIVPEDQRGDLDTFVQRCFTAGQVLFDCEHLSRSGRRMLVEVNTHLFELHGQRLVVAIARDISERQAARAQLQLLSRAIETSFSGFMITEVRNPAQEEDSPIIYVNSAFEQITGYTSSEVLDRSPRLLLADDRQQKGLKSIARALKTGRECRVVLRNYRKNGEMFWNMLQVSPVRNEAGLVTHHITAFEEVTRRRQMRHQRIRAALQLQKLSANLQNAREDERARIARELHDELGQTLTAVKMDIEFLRRQTLADSAAAKLDDMSELVEATLGAIRRIASDLRPVILDDLGLKAAVEWLAHDFRKRNPHIQCQLALELQEAQISDTLAIASFRVVQECLTNVARHAQASKVHVMMTLRHNRELAICVQDNGRGLPAMQEQPGSHGGYGLLGMRERVAALSGSYKLENLPGEGLIVDVTLPLREPEII